ncbi:hypothetical protein BGZ76_011437, partial [Entomortierella beljakovae]
MHNPKYYFLGSDQRGEYLLKRGDEEQESKNIGKATEYYNKAKKYCKNEAEERLKGCGQYFAGENKTTSTESTQGSGSSHGVKLVSRQFKLNGPYFPVLSILPIVASSSVTSSILSQESIHCTINDVQSTLVLANMFQTCNVEERKQINIMIDKIIQQFDENSCSKESIQELTVLAAIPDQRIFIAIISQLLKIEKSSPTFPELTIHGLAVIVASAPKEIDFKERQGLLDDILEHMHCRLIKIRTKNNSEELLPLLRALSALFKAMLCRGMKHLGRLEVYNPIKDRLTEIASDDNIDPEVSFMSLYASQSLAYIGNDESLAMSIFRRGRLAIGIVADIKSAVLEYDVGVFESVYGKILEMSDFTSKMEWYQGLLFIDCLLAKEDLPSFENFVIEGKLNSDEDFMQGVCLRLEQVAYLHSSQHIALGAQRLLQDLASNPSKKVQAMAQMVLGQLKTRERSISSTTTSDTSTLRATSDNQQTSPNVRLPPTWDKSWYSDTKSHLLKAAQDAIKRESNMLNIGSNISDVRTDISDVGNKLDKIIPTSNSMKEVHEALMDHYSSQLTIRRVSGNPLPLESCYVNLAIVEASRQREQDKEELKKHSEKFIRMPSFEDISSTNTEEPILLEEMLNKRKLLNGEEGVPKRILIIGRA